MATQGPYVSNKDTLDQKGNIVSFNWIYTVPSQ